MANNNHLIDKYIDALLVEAALRKNELNSETITTVYLGGGTPSLLSITQLSKLVNGLKKVFDFSDLEEFTIEVNPDDVTPECIQQSKSLGINRVSMGVQSFSDEDLRFINRRHTAKQATDAIHIIKEAGIDNISIDLIYGIPGQNFEIWKNNVDTAILLSVQHISAYTLMYEEGTRLSVMRSLGKITEVDDDVVTSQMIRYGLSYLYRLILRRQVTGRSLMRWFLTIMICRLHRLCLSIWTYLSIISSITLDLTDCRSQ